MLGVLGLDPLDPPGPVGGRSDDLRAVVDALVALALEQRAQARGRKDWAAADAVRDQLKHAGVVVEDTPHGPRWTMESRTDAGQLAAPRPADHVEEGRGRGPGGKNRDSLEGRGQTLPADERPVAQGLLGHREAARRTARKQDKERRAAAAEGRAPKIGQPGTQGHHLGPAAAVGGVPAAGARPPAARGGSAPAAAAPGSRRAAVQPARRTRRSCWSAATRWSRRCAPRCRPPRSTWRRASTSTTGSTRSSGPPPTGASPILEVSRAELDRMTGGVLHQGIGLQVPPFAYEPFDDLLAAALEQPAPLLVALDGVTDPRNLGAVIRSAAAFGAQGVFLPERRAAGITATAWRTSAGAAARVPVAQVTNLTRSLKACQEAGFIVVGLDADGDTDLYDLEAAVGPLVVVVGSEGRGLSRLVGETCDLRVSIPMISDGGVAERQRRRRGDPGRGRPPPLRRAERTSNEGPFPLDREVVFRRVPEPGRRRGGSAEADRPFLGGTSDAAGR